MPNELPGSRFVSSLPTHQFMLYHINTHLVPDITFQGFDPERILPVSLNNRGNEYFEFYNLLDERAPYTETVPSAASADSSVIVMEVKNVQSWTPPTPYKGRYIYNQRNIQAVDRWRHNIYSDYSKTSSESELQKPCSLPTPTLTTAARGGKKRPAQFCDDEMCDMHHGFNAAKRIKLQALDGPGVAAVDNERDGRGIYGKGQPGVQEWNRLGRDWEHARGYY